MNVPPFGRLWAIFALAAAAAGALLPLWLSRYYLDVSTQILIFAIFAMTIDFLAGYCGRVPLGHGALFGVSAYVLAYTTARAGGSLAAGVALGVLGSIGLSALSALLAVRTAGVYFLLLTLAEGMVVYGVAFRWTSVTGADNGIQGVVRPAPLDGPVAFYYLVLAAFLAVLLALRRMVRSPFGLTLHGIRECEPRMRSLGYNVPLHVFLAFVISGFFAGIAGALYALFNGFVSPAVVSLSQSSQGLVMVIVGGAGTLVGSLVGATLMILLETWVSLFTDRWPIVLGLVFMLTMVFAREGLLVKGRALVERWVGSALGKP